MRRASRAASSVAVPLATSATSQAISASRAWPNRMEIGRSVALLLPQGLLEQRPRFTRGQRHQEAKFGIALMQDARRD
jgi:hypothetical protein